MTAHPVTGPNGEHLVQVTLTVDVDPAWHGHNWHHAEIEDRVKSAIAREPGLELADDDEQAEVTRWPSPTPIEQIRRGDLCAACIDRLAELDKVRVDLRRLETTIRECGMWSEEATRG